MTRRSRPPGRWLVVYVYPGTGVPGRPLPPGWMDHPGAFGCTAQSCAFRDHAAELDEAGADVVGLSAQPLSEQREFAARERIPYPLLNDAGFAVADALGLPTFALGGRRWYERLTLVLRDGRVEKVFHPVAEPAEHAAEVLAWLRSPIEEVMRAERELLRTQTRRDAAAVDALLDDEFLEFGASGAIWMRTEIIDALACEPAREGTAQDMRAHWLGSDAALVTYEVVHPGAGRSLRSSVWVRRPAGWRLRFHQGTRAP